MTNASESDPYALRPGTPKREGVGDTAEPTPVSLGRVGSRIHSLRRAQGWTIEQMSQQSRVSMGLLSQIEKGKGNPSFNTLAQIAHSLGISVASLLAREQVHSPVVRRDERRAMEAHHAQRDHDAQHMLLTARPDSLLEVVEIEAPPGYDTSQTPFTHRGEEVGVILEGQHEVYLDGERFVLGPGDSISYPSSIPHWYRNPGPEVVRAIWIITPPTF